MEPNEGCWVSLVSVCLSIRWECWAWQLYGDMCFFLQELVILGPHAYSKLFYANFHCAHSPSWFAPPAREGTAGPPSLHLPSLPGDGRWKGGTGRC